MSDLSDFKRRVYEPEVAALKQQAANRSAIIVRLERVIDTLQAQSAAATSQIAAASDSRARLHDRFEAAEERIATLERERDEALAALDRLVAERDALDETLVNVGKAHGKQKARADAAEAELSRLREERAALATRLRDGAEHGETTEIRAWCLLALGES